MHPLGDTPAGTGLVETPSGLLVPATAADAVERAKAAQIPDAAPGQAGTQPEAFNRDPDGRRRIVLTRDEQKTINRAIRVLATAKLGIVIGCLGTCGQALKGEGRTPEGNFDAGYGCSCSRVHFR